MSFYESKRNRNKKESISQITSRVFVMRDGTERKATRVIVPNKHLKDKVDIHPLNPRYQEALTEEALSDILPSIQEVGVTFEGVAEYANGKYLLLDSSRRLAAAELTGSDLPLWAFDEGANLSRTDAEYITEISRLHRPLSRREHGLPLVKAIASDSSLEDYSVLLQKFRFKPTQERTVRRYVSAASLPQELIDLFPDSEGIPNDYYDSLKAICKAIGKKEDITQSKFEHDIYYFARLKPILLAWLKKYPINVDQSLETSEKQQLILQELKALVGNKRVVKVATWSTPDRIYNKTKHTYAELTRHKNGKEIQIRCRQLNKLQETQLVELLRSFND